VEQQNRWKRAAVDLLPRARRNATMAGYWLLLNATQAESSKIASLRKRASRLGTWPLRSKQIEKPLVNAYEKLACVTRLIRGSNLDLIQDPFKTSRHSCVASRRPWPGVGVLKFKGLDTWVHTRVGDF
jgi:hypothetical protein